MTSLQTDIRDMLKRSVQLCGTTIEQTPDGGYRKVPADKAVRDFLTTLCADKAEGDIKKAAELIVASWDDKSGSAARALNDARVYQVGNFIAADSVFRQAFFQFETLTPNEEPWIVNTTKNEIGVVDVSPDGSPGQIRVVRNDYKFALGLYPITSEWVKYNTMDILKGDVSEAQKATFDIARDLTFQLDRKHYTLLNSSCFGSFTTEQGETNPAKRIYLAHSGIVTANLPSTNDFVNADLRKWDGQDGLTGFRPAVMSLIGAYANRWDKYLPDTTSRLIPTGDIITPSKDIEDLPTGLLLENGTSTTDLQQQIQDNGYATLKVMGRNYRFIPDATINPGTCYPVFNLKPGLTFDKPSWAAEDVESSKSEHWERRKQGRAWNAAILTQWRPRAIRITYLPA